MERIEIKLDSKIYPKEAMLKAAYHFINEYYIHIEQVHNEYVITITAKNGVLQNSIKSEFENELLAQTVRLQVYKQTHIIRETLMARAMASTIIEEDIESQIDFPNNNESLEQILMDWFEKNE